MKIPNTGSKATCSSALFGLSDIEDDMTSGLIMVKKEKFASSLPPKRAHIDLTIKTPSSRRRKTVEATDLILEDLGPKEDLKKLISFFLIYKCFVNSGYYFSNLLMSFLFQVFDHISRSTVNLKIRAERAELPLMEKEKEWKPKNEDLLMRVEPLSKEKDENEGEHAAEMTNVIVEVRSSVVVVVREANIKLTEDVANVGSWKVVGWGMALYKPTGEPVNTSQDPAKSGR